MTSELKTPSMPLSWAARLALLLLAGLTAVLIVLLWPHWRQNPDLSHGYFMPLVFVLLLFESRRGTPRYLPYNLKFVGEVGTLLTLGLLAVVVSGLYAAALGWSHALVAFTLTGALVFLWGAALVVLAGHGARRIPLNWTSLVAVGLWLLAAPVPPGSYTRLTLGLQLMVTTNVLHALHVLGVAATQHGNIIDLANTTVGVEEACSGVRSLISCVFVGFFFSATLVRRPISRAIVIALSVPLALLMNFLRSLTLTLLANRGIDISGKWHDGTGFAVLGVTGVLLALLALALGRTDARALERRKNPAPPAVFPWYAAGTRLLFAGLALVTVLAAFFYLNTRPALRSNAPVPDLAGLLPAQVNGWEVKTSNDLYQFTSTLHTDHLAQRTYLRPTARGVEQITIYLAYWRAGQAPVSLVASHTPDACWPGSGWAPAAVPKPAEPLTMAGRELPDAESRLFKSGEYPQYVWFWHIYDGRPIAFRDPYSARALLNIAWHYGFRHDGDQLFVRVSSNRPWNEIKDTPFLMESFARLKPLGLGSGDKL